MPSKQPPTSPKKASSRLPCGRVAPSAGADSARRAPAGHDWSKRLADHLSAKGLKNSDQRWKIAELILSSGEHLDAQGIVERVKRMHPEIGAATVYRNIKVLCEAGILKESLMDSKGRVVYELADDEHHDHIVCLDCGEIFEFHSEAIESAQNAILAERSFAQVRHRHVIYAHCELNAERKPEPRRRPTRPDRA